MSITRRAFLALRGLFNFRERARRFDLEELWPHLRLQADFECAQLAFLLHAARDPAWSAYSTREIVELLRAIEHETIAVPLAEHLRNRGCK